MKMKEEKGKEQDIEKLLEKPRSFLNRVQGYFEQVFQKDFLRYFGKTLLYCLVFTLFFLLFSKTIGYTLPFIIALLLAALMQPLVRFLAQRLRWSKGSASGIVLALIIAVIGGLLTLLVVKIVGELIGLVQSAMQYDYKGLFEEISRVWKSLALPDSLQMDNALQTLGDQAASVIKSALSNVGKVFGGVWGVLSGLPAIVMMILVIVFATYYFARDWMESKQYPKMIFTPGILNNMKKIQTQGIRMLGRYIVAYMKLVLATTLQCLVIFLVLDIPYAFLFAALAGFFDLMPVVGASLVFIPLAVFYAFQGQWAVAILLIASLALISIVHQLLETRWVSESIEVHPLVMISIIFFGLKAGSFLLVIYLVAMVIGYKLLVQVELIDSPFAKLKKGKPKKKRRLWGKKRKGEAEEKPE